jgi:hypothetical protein
VYAFSASYFFVYEINLSPIKINSLRCRRIIVCGKNCCSYPFLSCLISIFGFFLFCRTKHRQVIFCNWLRDDDFFFINSRWSYYTCQHYIYTYFYADADLLLVQVYFQYSF